MTSSTANLQTCRTNQQRPDLPNVIHLRRKLFAAPIRPEPMIEISFLPHHCVVACVETFQSPMIALIDWLRAKDSTACKWFGISKSSVISQRCFAS